MEVFSAKYLVEQMGVPDKYLRRLMTDMSKKGFIKSLQGREGGYVFAKSARNIYLSEVIEAVEGMDKYCGCILGFESCGNDNPCSLHKTYGPIKEDLIKFLSNTTIWELRDRDVQKF